MAYVIAVIETERNARVPEAADEGQRSAVHPLSLCEFVSNDSWVVLDAARTETSTWISHVSEVSSH